MSAIIRAPKFTSLLVVFFNAPQILDITVPGELTNS